MPGTVGRVPGHVDEEEARRRLAEAAVARLATIDEDGRPHIVPCCFVLDGDTIYSAVDSKPKRTQALRRLDNVRANPVAAVLADHYEDDWSRLWWVRARGEAAVLAEGGEAEHARGLLAAKYHQYREQPPSGPVVAVRVTEWRAWSGG